VFYRKGKDIIDWVKTDTESVWQPQNLTKLNNLGTEIQVQLDLRELIGKAFPNDLGLSYLYNNLQKEDSEFISNYVLDNLKHKFVGTVNQSVTERITVNLKITFQDREGTYTEFVNNDWGNEVKYEPFWLFAAKVSYDLRYLNIYISANNIFNTTYNDIGNVVQPGRWIKAGISYKINIK
jgi:iron complex outermembrane receptor protein